MSSHKLLGWFRLGRLRRAALALGVASAVGGLAACGFTPIAAPTFGSQTAMSVSELAIAGVDDRFVYGVRKEFLDFAQEDAASPVSLRVQVTVRSESFAIEDDDTVTRISLNYVARYAFVINGEIVDQGTLRSAVGYNATTSQFASAVSRRDAEEKLAQDLGRKLLTILRARESRLTAMAGG